MRVHDSFLCDMNHDSLACNMNFTLLLLAFLWRANEMRECVRVRVPVRVKAGCARDSFVCDMTVCVSVCVGVCRGLFLIHDTRDIHM